MEQQKPQFNLCRTKVIIDPKTDQQPQSNIQGKGISSEELWKLLEEDDEEAPTYEKLDDQIKQQIPITIEYLKEKTETEILKTIKNKQQTHRDIVKSLVSKKKSRFCYDGFDLDLTYITTRIIAMGFPSTSLEGIYRNKLEDVKEFFIQRHPYHYKVYNLCAERTYPEGTFYNQAYYPFKDHEAPPLNLLMPLCIDVKKFLDKDVENVVAIHCKAGKGRTGTVITCLLLYLNYFDNIDDCLQYYGLMRTEDSKGVTIPSQIRYVYYFEKIVKNDIAYPIQFVTKAIKKLKMISVPNFHVYNPSFDIDNNHRCYKYNDYKKSRDFNEKENCIDFNLGLIGYNVTGDVKITFFRNPIIGSREKTFSFWFNTNFVTNDDKPLVLQKYEIDKACKDLKQKIFKDDFKIEVYFFTKSETDETNKRTRKFSQYQNAKNVKKDEENDSKKNLEKIPENEEKTEEIVENVNTLEQILRNEDEKKENEENNKDEKKENDDKIN